MFVPYLCHPRYRHFASSCSFKEFPEAPARLERANHVGGRLDSPWRLTAPLGWGPAPSLAAPYGAPGPFLRNNRLRGPTCGLTVESAALGLSASSRPPQATGTGEARPRFRPSTPLPAPPRAHSSAPTKSEGSGAPYLLHVARTAERRASEKKLRGSATIRRA